MILRILLLILLWPSLAQATWAHVGNVLTDNNKSNSTTWAPTTSATVEVDNVIVCVQAVNNISTGGGETNDHTSVTDVRSNTWIKAREHSNTASSNSACTVSVWYSKISTELVSGDAITFTITTNRNAKAATCEEFTMLSTNVLTVDGTTGNQADASEIGALTLSGLENREHLIVRGICGETDDSTAWTADADYTGFTMTSSTTTGGNFQLNMGARGDWQIKSATASDEDDPTWGSTMDNASAMVALDEDAPAAGRSRRMM